MEILCHADIIKIKLTKHTAIQSLHPPTCIKSDIKSSDFHSLELLEAGKFHDPSHIPNCRHSLRKQHGNVSLQFTVSTIEHSFAQHYITRSKNAMKHRDIRRVRGKSTEISVMSSKNFTQQDPGSSSYSTIPLGTHN